MFYFPYLAVLCVCVLCVVDLVYSFLHSEGGLMCRPWREFFLVFIFCSMSWVYGWLLFCSGGGVLLFYLMIRKPNRLNPIRTRPVTRAHSLKLTRAASTSLIFFLFVPLVEVRLISGLMHAFTLACCGHLPLAYLFHGLSSKSVFNLVGQSYGVLSHISWVHNSWSTSEKSASSFLFWGEEISGGHRSWAITNKFFCVFSQVMSRRWHAYFYRLQCIFRSRRWTSDGFYISFVVWRQFSQTDGNVWRYQC